jgi:transposase
MRALKRRLSDIVYRTMLGDLVTGTATGSGGHRGNVSDSSAAGSHPHQLFGQVTSRTRQPPA